MGALEYISMTLHPPLSLERIVASSFSTRQNARPINGKPPSDTTAALRPARGGQFNDDDDAF